jgi:hypothetical protein
MVCFFADGTADVLLLLATTLHLVPLAEAAADTLCFLFLPLFGGGGKTGTI